jgi:hypothetical protein
MGYINDGNRKTVEDRIFNLMMDARAARQDGIGLNGAGINFLGEWALSTFDQTGAINLRTILELIKTIIEKYPTLSAEYPHADDPQLKWLDSIEAINEAKADVIKRYMQPVAVDSGLFQRFNERVGFMKSKNVHRPKVEAVQEAAKPLTPKEQAAAKVKTEIDAVKSEIDTATKGYTQYAIRQREKLHARFAELLADMPRAKFFDRYGSQERLTGWPAVQRIIRQEIRDCNNPIK